MKRYMKNTRTGVVFHFDEAQVADSKKNWMVECDAEGNIVHAVSASEEAALRRQIAELKVQLEASGNTPAALADLNERVVVLGDNLAEVGRLAQALAATGVTDADQLEEITRSLLSLAGMADIAPEEMVFRSSLAGLLETPAAAAVAGGTGAAAAAEESVEPKIYTQDEIDDLREKARAHKIRGFTKLDPAELDQKIQLAEAEQD